jgi:hypothetical protein
MNLLYVVATGSVVALTLVLSTYKVKKKKIQMYKEKYEKALKTGDRQKIVDAGFDYYTLIKPSLSKDVDIEATILKDIQDHTSKKDSEGNR